MRTSQARWVAFLFVVVISSIGFRCSSYHLPGVAEPPDYCVGPTGPYWRPVVCVDETLVPVQKVTVVSDVEPQTPGSKVPSNRPVQIFWRTHKPTPLQITFDDTNCLLEGKQPVCDANGHCSATVAPLESANGVKQNRRCTYHVMPAVNPKADPDGDIVVIPCCM